MGCIGSVGHGVGTPECHDMRHWSCKACVTFSGGFGCGSNGVGSARSRTNPLVIGSWCKKGAVLSAVLTSIRNFCHGGGRGTGRVVQVCPATRSCLPSSRWTGMCAGILSWCRWTWAARLARPTAQKATACSRPAHQPCDGARAASWWTTAPPPIFAIAERAPFDEVQEMLK